MRLVGEVQDEKQVLQQVGSEGRSFAAVTEADGDGKGRRSPFMERRKGRPGGRELRSESGNWQVAATLPSPRQTRSYVECRTLKRGSATPTTTCFQSLLPTTTKELDCIP